MRTGQPDQNNAECQYTICGLEKTLLPEVIKLYATAIEAERRVPLYPGKDESPDTTVLGAISSEGKLIGTISFTADGPSGLHTDFAFHEETERERQRGRRLFSAWRIATGEEYRGSALALALIRETIRQLVCSNMQTTLMIFPPEHVRTYEALLGAMVVAERSVDLGCGAAFAVLMRVDIEQLRERRRFREIFQ